MCPLRRRAGSRGQNRLVAHEIQKTGSKQKENEKLFDLQRWFDLQRVTLFLESLSFGK